MSMVNIDMANNVVVAMAVEVAVAVVDWKTILIGKWTVQSAEQVQQDISEKCDESDDEDGSSYLLRALTSTPPT